MNSIEAATELRILRAMPARDPIAHALMCLKLALVADGVMR